MIPPPTDDLTVLRETFVRPFYLRLLHGNFRRLEDDDGRALRQAIADAARSITDEQIEALLREREWRGRLSAAWFVGLGKRAGFVDRIGELLLASELVYSGEGYCLALGLIGGARCADLLRSYLGTYLPLNGRVYNQDWAIGALAHIEGAPPAEFADPSLWRSGTYVMDPLRGIEAFSRTVSDLAASDMIRD